MSTNAINIQQLPLEVLQYIFILSSNPHFPLVSQNFYKAANSQTSVKTQWLMCKFKEDCKKAMFRGLKWRFFNKEILNQLDNLYRQQNPTEVRIPYDGRPIPQWFFHTEDPDGRILELTEILLNRNASPDETNGYPITKSAQMGNIRMANLLINYGVKVNINEDLALRISVAKGNLEMVTLLLEHGAQPDEKTLKIAIEHRNKDVNAADKYNKIYELLKSHGAVEDLGVVNAFR